MLAPPIGADRPTLLDAPRTLAALERLAAGLETWSDAAAGRLAATGDRPFRRLRHLDVKVDAGTGSPGPPSLA